MSSHTNELYFFLSSQKVMRPHWHSGHQFKGPHVGISVFPNCDAFLFLKIVCIC